jgi:hypothetical protein
LNLGKDTGTLLVEVDKNGKVTRIEDPSVKVHSTNINLKSKLKLLGENETKTLDPDVRRVVQTIYNSVPWMQDKPIKNKIKYYLA